MKKNTIERITANSIVIDGVEYFINQPIPKLEGVISGIKPARAYGKGIIRNAVLDGQIKINAIDHPEFNESFEARPVVIQCAVLVEEDYKGKRLALKINSKGKIECIEVRILQEEPKILVYPPKVESSSSSEQLKGLGEYLKWSGILLKEVDIHVRQVGKQMGWDAFRTEKESSILRIPIQDLLAKHFMAGGLDNNQSKIA